MVGSFYPLFSFLFGLGFSLYLRKGDEALPLFRRRLAILLLIGLMHAVFIWSGDILVTYALVGFLLIAFRRQSDKALLGWIMALTVWTFAVVWLLAGSEDGFALSYIEQATRAYGKGSYLEAIRQRLADTGLTLLNLPVAGPQILAFFLGGLFSGRQKRLEDAAKHRLFWKRVCLVSFLIGAPIVGAHAFLVLRSALVSSFLSALDLTLGSPALGFGYLAGLSLCLTPSVQRRLRSLAAVGAHSAHELPSAVGYLYTHLLRLWRWFVRRGKPDMECHARFRYLPATDGTQSLVADSLQVRTYRVGMALFGRMEGGFKLKR